MHNQSLCTGHESPIGLTRRRFLNRFGMGLGALHWLICSRGNKLQALAAAIPAFCQRRITRPRRNGSSISFRAAGRPSSKHSITSRCSTRNRGSSFPSRCGWGSASPECRGTRRRCRWPVRSSSSHQARSIGAWISELLPHTSKVVDELAIIRSMTTEAINHDPAITFLQTGNQLSGRPSIGAWLSYGLGSDNENLPAFVVLITKGKGDQPLYSRLWGTGFLPSKFQGVQFRSGKEPVLYLNNPSGVDRDSRRNMLDRLKELHELELEATGDSELNTRIAQYEMAFRMQASVPEVTDLSPGAAAHLRPVWPGCENAGNVRGQLSAGAATGRTGRQVYPTLPPGVGSARRIAERDLERNAAIPINRPRHCSPTIKQRGLLDGIRS